MGARLRFRYSEPKAHPVRSRLPVTGYARKPTCKHALTKPKANAARRDAHQCPGWGNRDPRTEKQIARAKPPDRRHAGNKYWVRLMFGRRGSKQAARTKPTNPFGSIASRGGEPKAHIWEFGAAVSRVSHARIWASSIFIGLAGLSGCPRRTAINCAAMLMAISCTVTAPMS